MHYIIIAAAQDEDIRKHFDGTGRTIAANAMEQLGYQAETVTWRNFYLTGAQELRQGKATPTLANRPSWDTLLAMPTTMLLDYMGTRLDTEKAQGRTIGLNIILRCDKQEECSLLLRNSVINNRTEGLRNADATLALDAASLAALITGMVSYSAVCVTANTNTAQQQSPCTVVQGDTAKAAEVFSLLTPAFPRNCPLVAPDTKN